MAPLSSAKAAKQALGTGYDILSSGGTVISVQEREKQLSTLFDKLASSSALNFTMEPAGEVSSTLYPHQKQALAWMVRTIPRPCVLLAGDGAMLQLGSVSG